MLSPLPFAIGLRYTRARRRNHFISFISLSSILGLALGVTALITVLSVMNGFEKELRSRILGMASHATIESLRGSLERWQDVAAVAARTGHVIGVAPYVSGEVMFTAGRAVSGALVRGVLPEREPRVSDIRGYLIQGSLEALEPGSWRVILGVGLARRLGVRVGDRVTMVAPQGSVTPVGILPRLRRLTVAGLFEVGHAQFDGGFALMHLDDARKLFRLGAGVTGLRLKLDDVFLAPAVSQQLARSLGGGFWVSDWTRQHANFFRALRTEKVVMFIILALIVAVAAFNIVSTLVMVVTDKQADIAILRTLGMAPTGILAVFVVQGVVIGLLGTLIGAAGGIALALNVETIVPAIERLFHTRFLSPEVYYISELPSDLRSRDVVLTLSVAFAMCVSATLYPAWRASRTDPAEALRYE